MSNIEDIFSNEQQAVSKPSLYPLHAKNLKFNEFDFAENIEEMKLTEAHEVIHKGGSITKKQLSEMMNTLSYGEKPTNDKLRA